MQIEAVQVMGNKFTWLQRPSLPEHEAHDKSHVLRQLTCSITFDLNVSDVLGSNLCIV
jgi:hypothetical protein